METKGFRITLSDEEIKRETAELMALRKKRSPTRIEFAPAPPEVTSILTDLTKAIKVRFKENRKLYPLIRVCEAQLGEHGCSFKPGWFGSTLNAETDEATFINPGNFISNKGRIAIPPVKNAEGKTVTGALAITLPSNGHPHEEEIFRPW